MCFNQIGAVRSAHFSLSNLSIIPNLDTDLDSIEQKTHKHFSFDSLLHPLAKRILCHIGRRGDNSLERSLFFAWVCVNYEVIIKEWPKIPYLKKAHRLLLILLLAEKKQKQNGNKNIINLSKEIEIDKS